MRKLIHQIHLWLSIPVGLIISLLCLTGAALVFEKDITEALNPHLYHTDYRKGDVPLSPSALVQRIRTQMSDSLEISALELPGSPEGVCMVSVKGAGKKSLSVNPYTGDINGWTKSYPFFQTMRQLHRWLMDVPPQKGAKTTGKYIVGISTLLMAFILISGIVLWMPRNRKALKNRLTVSFTKGWRRFWYDSHVSLGAYAALFLLVMTLTGLTWSFQWYRNAAYGLFGALPSQSSAHAAAPGAKGSPDKPKKKTFDYTAWDKALAAVQSQYPSYASLKLTSQEILVNHTGQMRKYDLVRLQAQSGEIESITTDADIPVSKKIKGWFYAFHTGTWGGVATKVLYFLAALIGGILPLSGYYLWIRKKTARAKKRKPQSTE